ncbi:MAG: Gfo/Idh/MocA family oxidoreductase [candidate division Zixibacteria bacterium]|nr:Gfo/Idh/MocA family oxidoreductase [candidate division Zixibacteria bacterium]
MKPIKTAVVGVGALGKHHLRWMSQLHNAELVGIFDTDRSRADALAKEYNTRTFQSLDQLAEKAEAVSIAVTTSAHYAVASELIRRGIHCLIEKPVTSTYEQARELIALGTQHGVKVAVGQIERFNPAVQALAPYAIRPSFIEAHRLAAFDPRGTDVAVVLDLMIHDIDLVLHFVKAKLIDIQASAVAIVSVAADIANARLTFANGTVANLTASRISLRPMRKFRIFQPSGYYSLDLAVKQADIYKLATDTTEAGMRVPLGKSGKDILYVKKSDTGKDMLGAEIESFLNAIINDSSVAVSLEEATEALRVALEVERIGKSSIELMMAHTG